MRAVMASHNTDGQRELGISLHPKLPTTRRTTTMKYLSILVVCIMITACSGRINLIAELPKDQDLDVTIKTSKSGGVHKSNTPTAE
tara:strand:+ start:381 stop:638 length:258 start_codon:yes stop_codon:yes gene_type:complete